MGTVRLASGTDRTLLDGIIASLDDRKVIALAGIRHSGKSTLLQEAAHRFSLREGTVITNDREDELVRDGLKIHLVPLLDFLLKP